MMLKDLTRNGWMCVRNYAKDVRFGSEARSLLLRGVNIMANAVAPTLGPRGRNVLIEQLLISPRITKDGVTVANNVQLKDRRWNLGAQLLRQAANSTNNDVSNGTTTTAILARAMVCQGIQATRAGQLNVQLLREGILEASRVVCEALAEMSEPVETISQVEAVALVSLNGNEQEAELIGDTILELGEHGVILIKKSHSSVDFVKIHEGLSLPSGYCSPYFATSTSSNILQLGNCLLLLTLVKIDEMSQILPALEMAKEREQPLLIIAPHFANDVMKALVLNIMQGHVEVCAVKAPSFGDEQREEMRDVAVAVGATLLEDAAWLASFTEDDLGEVVSVFVDAKSTSLFQPINANEEEVENRIGHLQVLIGEAVTDEELDKLNTRLGRLQGHVATIHVAGSSELEMEERKIRFSNAIDAVRLAIFDGVVPGGGCAYLRCIPALQNLPVAQVPERQMGREIVRDALHLPTYTIALNAGADPDEVVRKVLAESGSFGFDAATRDICNLYARGIVDPTNVMQAAVSVAAGIASMLATTEVLITEQPVEPKIPRNQVTRDLARLVGM